ncbi:MAG: HPr family phosphocarrier protein [Eubacterium sp.]|nr:HPr family phosphocarrier protein [Eubacterium sp.]
MIKKNIDVSVGEEGARPIAMLVQLASQFKSNIELRRDSMTVNAKSIMGMMTLGLVQGQNLEISIEGEDEEEAMKEMENYLTGK